MWQVFGLDPGRSQLRRLGLERRRSARLIKTTPLVAAFLLPAACRSETIYDEFIIGVSTAHFGRPVPTYVMFFSEERNPLKLATVGLFSLAHPRQHVVASERFQAYIIYYEVLGALAASH